MAIHISPSHKGLLHRDLGVPEGEPIPESKIRVAEHSADPAERKRAVFAENARHFNHAGHARHSEHHGRGSGKGHVGHR